MPVTRLRSTSRTWISSIAKRLTCFASCPESVHSRSKAPTSSSNPLSTPPNATRAPTDFSGKTVYILAMKTREIAELVGGELVGDGDVDIHSIATITSAGEGQIAFSENAETDAPNAGCVLVGRSFSGGASSTFIRVDDPKLAFAILARELHPPKKYSPERHSSAAISG